MIIDTTKNIIKIPFSTRSGFIIIFYSLLSFQYYIQTAENLHLDRLNVYRGIKHPSYISKLCYSISGYTLYAHGTYILLFCCCCCAVFFLFRINVDVDVEKIHYKKCDKNSY